ncbi:MAG: hypothetical protein FWG79_09135 [Bacteroidales bacterium]|nr:hypothetical protein [Bacteroidales bacterium]
MKKFLKLTVLAAVLLMLTGGFTSCDKNTDLIPAMDNDENIFPEIDFCYFPEIDFFYGEDGEKIFFKVRKDVVVLHCKSETEAKTLAEQPIFIFATPLNTRLVAIIDSLLINLNALMKRTDVVDGAYGLVYIDGIYPQQSLQFPTHKIFVKIKENQLLEEVLEHVNLTKYVQDIKHYHRYCLITLDVELGDILRICRDLYESGLCEWVEPNFSRITER